MPHVHQASERALTDWNTGLCDCFEDASTCCYGFWCCLCLAGTVSNRFGESTCLPLCDVCSPAVFSCCGIPLFAPPAVISMRASMRNRYGIKGSICRDIVTGCFCSWCSWCQMHRELKERKKAPKVINAQPLVATVPLPPLVINAGYPPPVNVMNQGGIVMMPQ